MSGWRSCGRCSRPGFGNALNEMRTVRGFERAGAAMIQLDDQGFPKRCGHLDGKTAVPAAEPGARGFRIVIFPGGAARAVAHTLQGYGASLATHGTAAPWRERMLDFDGLNALIGTPERPATGRRCDDR